MSDQTSSGPAAPVAAAARRASRFSRDFLATVISLVTTALGVVVALAWNSAFTGLFALWSPAAKVTALFVYALVITAIGVVAIISLARLAARIGAEPIEFKYPGKGKDDK